VRRLLRNRYFLPATMMAAVVVGGVFGFSGAAIAGGQAKGVSNGTVIAGVYFPPGSFATGTCGGYYQLKGVTATKNSGGPNSSVRVCKGGRLVAYGNSAITYVDTTRNQAVLALGDQLFQQNCSSCHGSTARGYTPSGTSAELAAERGAAPSSQGQVSYPDLRGLGPATILFWVDTGRMPAKDPNSVEAERKTPALTPNEARAVAAWIQSLDPATPFVPNVNLKGANVADGASLFALNCAACHTITGSGDALAQNTYAPTLHIATTQEIASAVRTGPGDMPRFTGNLSDYQLRDIVAYVTGYIQKPTNPGGNGLGGIGPVTEGFIGLLFGVGGFCLICFWIGDRERGA
jgi:ubiquinol-cytochrome c reductase cytochrome c subunit